jgi:hypothetical protein|tara:strand:- start:94 stop:285 length:192 start_codon:yes stop_codon:yes gene_type:complete
MILRKRKMIKWIKNLFAKIFGVVEKPLILEKEIKEVIIESKKIQCNTHSRFKKSCPICVEAVK